MGPTILQTDGLSNGPVFTAALFASLSGAGSGNNTVIAAVTGKRARVVAGFLMAASAVTVAFQDGAGGTGLSGVMSLITGTPLVLPFCPLGYFQTTANTLLNMSLGGAVQVSGSLVYILV